MKTIDELMDTDPDELTNEDIDGIIAYERKQRGMFDSGIKPKKAEGEKKVLDISGILAGLRGEEPAPVVEPPKPRIGRRV